MKLFYLILLAAGFVTFTNELPTPTVTSDVLKDQCTDKGINEEKRLGVYLGTLQFGTVMFLSTMGNRTAEFCSEVPTFQKQINKFGKDASLCLAKPQAYMVNFGYEAVSETLSFLCKSGGQNIDILFSNQTQQCEKKLQSSSIETKLQMCIEELYDIFFFKRIEKNICRSIKKTELCSKRILSKYCSEFTSVLSLHRDFFRVIAKPCNRDSNSSVDSNEV